MIDALLVSLKLACLSSAIIILLGLPLANILARRNFWAKRFLESLLLLPLTLPPTVLGFYLLMFLGVNGPLATFNLTWAFRFEGILLGSVLFSFPFALNTYREAISAIDKDLLELNKSLGANVWQSWYFVILPLSWPGVLSGTLLAFAHTLGEFGVILMIGGSIPGQTKVLSIYIYDLVQAMKFEETNRISLFLLLFSLAIIYTVRYLESYYRERLK